MVSRTAVRGGRCWFAKPCAVSACNSILYNATTSLGIAGRCQNGIDSKLPVVGFKLQIVDSGLQVVDSKHRVASSKPRFLKFEAPSRQFEAPSCRSQASSRQVGASNCRFEAPNSGVRSFKLPIRSFRSPTQNLHLTGQNDQSCPNRQQVSTRCSVHPNRGLEPVVLAFRQQRSGFAKPPTATRTMNAGSQTTTRSSNNERTMAKFPSPGDRRPSPSVFPLRLRQGHRVLGACAHVGRSSHLLVSGVYVRVYWYCTIDELLIRRSWVDAPPCPPPHPRALRDETQPGHCHELHPDGASSF